MLRRAEDCRKLAEDCMASAENAKDEELRQLLARIAAQWNRLADHVEACERFTRAGNTQPGAEVLR